LLTQVLRLEESQPLRRPRVGGLCAGLCSEKWEVGSEDWYHTVVAGLCVYGLTTWVTQWSQDMGNTLAVAGRGPGGP